MSFLPLQKHHGIMGVVAFVVEEPPSLHDPDANVHVQDNVYISVRLNLLYRLPSSLSDPQFTATTTMKPSVTLHKWQIWVFFGNLNSEMFHIISLSSYDKLSGVAMLRFRRLTWQLASLWFPRQKAYKILIGFSYSAENNLCGEHVIYICEDNLLSGNEITKSKKL